MEILIDLKSKIEKIEDKESLTALKAEIMGNSAEFKVLSKHQGLFANVFIRTKSQQALEKMFADKEQELATSNKLKSN